MEVTRRYWALVSVGGILAVLAVVFARPVLLYGAAGVAAVLLVRQYRFLARLAATDRALAVKQSLPAQRVSKGESTPATLSVRLARPAALDLAVGATLPVLADGPTRAARSVTVDTGDQEATTVFDVAWPVVGRTQLPPATVTATGWYGLFREVFPRGPEPGLVVDPRVPRNVHVGEGGDRTMATFGGHRSDQLGSGTDPAEIRQYVAGDSISDIDWKATARLDYPHVREYEVETDRRTLLVVDHRGSLATGPDGETKLDYLREVALTLATQADELNDPIGLAGIGEDGTSAWEPPSTGQETYDAVRSTLHGLTASGPARADGYGVHPSSVATAHQRATRLAGDESAYGQNLRPFFGDAEQYVQRAVSNPLFETVRTRTSQAGSASWVMVFTDDTDRTALRETVKFAASEAAGVVVFLTPTVLFERDGLTDLNAAYREYVDFEEFRRELARLDGVSAFEVGPEDRVQAVLDAGRRSRE